MELNLNKIIQNTIKDIDFDEIFKEKLKETLTNSIKSILEDNLRSWSGFGKQLDEALKNSLKINTDSFDVSSYCEFVNNEAAEVIKTIMSDEKAMNIKMKVAEHLNISMVESMSFTELVEKLESIINAKLDEEKSECYCGELPEFKLEAVYRNETYGNYRDVSIKKDDEKIAKLHLNSEGKCYHYHTNYDGCSFKKLFSMLTFGKVKITNFEEMSETFTAHEDY